MDDGKTALLVLDAQKAYTSPASDLHCEDSEETIRNVSRVIERFEAQGGPVFLVRHTYRPDGSDLGCMYAYGGDPENFHFKAGTWEVEYDANLKRPRSATQILKNRYSAFENTDLEVELRIRGIEKVVITGFMTNFCCESTARDAHDKDFLVTFLPDATGCPALPGFSQEEIRRIVGKLLEAGFAEVQRTEPWLSRSAGPKAQAAP